MVGKSFLQHLTMESIKKVLCKEPHTVTFIIMAVLSLVGVYIFIGIEFLEVMLLSFAIAIVFGVVCFIVFHIVKKLQEHCKNV